MNAIKNTTTIQLKRSTRERLASIGKMDQTFDSLIDEVLKHLEKCDRFWSENR